jgi:hypothetical protein
VTRRGRRAYHSPTKLSQTRDHRANSHQGEDGSGGLTPVLVAIRLTDSSIGSGTDPGILVVAVDPPSRLAPARLPAWADRGS